MARDRLLLPIFGEFGVGAAKLDELGRLLTVSVLLVNDPPVFDASSCLRSAEKGQCEYDSVHERAVQ